MWHFRRMVLCPLLHLTVDPFNEPSNFTLKLFVDIDACDMVMDKVRRVHDSLR